MENKPVCATYILAEFQTIIKQKFYYNTEKKNCKTSISSHTVFIYYYLFHKTQNALQHNLVF